MQNHFAQFHDTTRPILAAVSRFSVANDPLSRYATASPCRLRVWVEPVCKRYNSRARTTYGPHGRQRTRCIAHPPWKNHPPLKRHAVACSARPAWSLNQARCRLTLPSQSPRRSLNRGTSDGTSLTAGTTHKTEALAAANLPADVPNFPPQRQAATNPVLLVTGTQVA
jgi:hypothetical protein